MRMIIFCAILCAWISGSSDDWGTHIEHSAHRAGQQARKNLNIYLCKSCSSDNKLPRTSCTQQPLMIHRHRHSQSWLSGKGHHWQLPNRWLIQHISYCWFKRHEWKASPLSHVSSHHGTQPTSLAYSRFYIISVWVSSNVQQIDPYIGHTESSLEGPNCELGGRYIYMYAVYIYMLYR